MPENPAVGFSRKAAINLLRGCSSLAQQLTAHGLNMEINQEEQQVLLGPAKVWLAGYPDGSSHVYREASLVRGELAALSRLLVQIQGEGMRQLHEAANG